MLLLLALYVLFLASVTSAKTLAKLGDGQCNGGVGGTGRYKCLVGGTCNEGGIPEKLSTSTGTSCPGDQEYLLCTEDASVDLDTCRSACVGDPDCTGFMLSSHVSKGTSRCELHTKLIEFASEPLECYSYVGGSFSFLGKGACRTKEVTKEGPQKDTHYGYMEVVWVPGLVECQLKCQNSVMSCVGIEFQPTATNAGHKCELHFEALSADQMSTFQCWVAADVSAMSKLGDGQCNGGVGGIGDFKCLDGGDCNDGGAPIRPATEKGTGCEGEKEYLLCDETSDIDLDRCKTACAVDAECEGFLVTIHAALGTSRCELHTKPIEFASDPLECHSFSEGVMSRMGNGACRTKELTQEGPQNGTRYGYMSISWVPSFTECKSECQNSVKPCFGVEYHPTAIDDGTHKCEVHYEELSAAQMSTMQCWVKSTPLTTTSTTVDSDDPQSTVQSIQSTTTTLPIHAVPFDPLLIVVVGLAVVAMCTLVACCWLSGVGKRISVKLMPGSVIGAQYAEDRS